MADKPRMPQGFSAAGKRLWHSIVDTYELRADEQLVLEKACRTADDSDRLDKALAAAPLMVMGSKGQSRHNPLLHEARQTRALLASLLKQLALPDDPPAEGALSTNSQRATKAARARWGVRTPHGA